MEPDLTCAKLVSLASVRQDGDFDEASIADVLFVALMLANLRDEHYEPME